VSAFLLDEQDALSVAQHRRPFAIHPLETNRAGGVGQAGCLNPSGSQPGSRKPPKSSQLAPVAVDASRLARSPSELAAPCPASGVKVRFSGRSAGNSRNQPFAPHPGARVGSCYGQRERRMLTNLQGSSARFRHGAGSLELLRAHKTAAPAGCSGLRERYWPIVTMSTRLLARGSPSTSSTPPRCLRPAPPYKPDFCIARGQPSRTRCSSSRGSVA